MTFAIRAERLGKQYHIGLSHPIGKKAVAMMLAGRRSILSSASRTSRKPEPNEDLRQSETPDRGGDEIIWAIRDVSFEVRPGEVVGLIGANGAGKSTLLKILSRITRPTVGKAWMNGRIGSLLEVGTGFHQELTGRENVYLSGAILGMRRAEIDRKFDEIVDFSGVEKFIDTPIKRYSSGMKVRLGFAVAAHLEPEILLVDEVLAVGDMNFQEKALGRMRNVVGGGRTVLFVSHNMTAIAQLCERVLLMEGGHIVFDGPANEAITRYLGLDTMSGEQFKSLADYRRPDSTVPFFKSVHLCGELAPNRLVLPSRSAFVVEIEGDTRGQEFHNFRAGVHFYTDEGIRLLSTVTAWSPLGHFDVKGTVRLRCEIPELPLLPGRYLVAVGVSSGRQILEMLENLSILTIRPVREGNIEATPRQKADGYFWVDSQWRAEQTTR